MSAEGHVLEAIRLTRITLARAFDDSRLLVYMAANNVSPDDIKDMVTEILEYLDKTKEEV